jgi:hypothetical protein
MSTIYQCDRCKKNMGKVTMLLRITSSRLIDARTNEVTGLILGEVCQECVDVVRLFVQGEHHA